MSNDINKRWKSHKDRYDRQGPEYEKSLYRAMRKYGIDNFSIEVLQEENNEEERKRLEIYYIEKYDTFNHGYNETKGGDIGQYQKGENHGRARLTLEEVKDIRIRYNNHERFHDVYELYKDKISYGGFSKVWNFVNWKDVYPEYHTKENIDFHTHNTGNSGSRNGRAILTEEDIRNIRTRKKNEEDKDSVWKDYSNKIVKNHFTEIWENRCWKNVIV